jgi:hypothetical protein
MRGPRQTLRSSRVATAPPIADSTALPMVELPPIADPMALPMVELPPIADPMALPMVEPPAPKTPPRGSL